MDGRQLKKTSKFLSLILRHEPEAVGIELDPSGWVDVDALIEGINRNGTSLTVEQLRQVVETNDKQRFVFSEDGQRIRANQGHSVEVELGYEPTEPPEILLHGTPDRFLDEIRESGLKKMARHHVHLHEDATIASAVGNRRGKPVILQIRSAQMHAEGHVFYVTPNRVWLVDSVPANFIVFPNEL